MTKKCTFEEWCRNAFRQRFVAAVRLLNRKKEPVSGFSGNNIYLFYLRIYLRNLFILLHLFRETLINSSAR